MSRPPFELPDTAALAQGLHVALSGVRIRHDEVAILERSTNHFTSSHATEVISCRIDGSDHMLLVKYGVRDHRRDHERQGGVGHEAFVYEKILGKSNLSTLRFFGSFEDRANRNTWLFLEYLDGSFRSSKINGAIMQAAEWLGRFHAEMEAADSASLEPYLRIYDEEYYLSWVDRLSSHSEILATQYPWLPEILGAAECLLVELGSEARTVIHGELYPSNVLFHNGQVYPIDWETAALAPGEIDLASLVENWGEAVTESMVNVYAKARWNEIPSPRFRRTFLIAKIFWHMRWLGKGAWNPHDDQSWRLNQLRKDWRHAQTVLNLDV